MFLPALLRTGLGEVLECELFLGKEEDDGYPWLTIKNKIQLWNNTTWQNDFIFPLGLFQGMTSLTSSVWSWKAVHSHWISPRNRWSRCWCCCINIRPYGWWIRSSAGISAGNTFCCIGIRIAMFIWRIIGCRWNGGPGKGVWGAIVLYSGRKTCKINNGTLAFLNRNNTTRRMRFWWY